MTRDEARARYEALPVPDTTLEPWRFTDLSGFDPDDFSTPGDSHVTVPGSELLDIAVAGVAKVSETGIEIERAPEGVTFEPLTREADRLGGLVALKQGKIPRHNVVAGVGATSRVTGAYFSDGDQHLDYDTFQEHIAPNTTSDFAFKGALRDEATAVWRGMIRVEEDAQKTNAYQECRNLMLSPTTHAVPIPGLEILANDVRCTHAATVGRVNREDMFYLMSRGLTRQEAERLIVRGFFQEVLDRIELEPVREAVTSALEARIPQA